MTGRPTQVPLTDWLALAIPEHGPAAAHRLTLIVRARRDDVGATVRADPRFEYRSAGRGADEPPTGEQPREP